MSTEDEFKNVANHAANTPPASDGGGIEYVEAEVVEDSPFSAREERNERGERRSIERCFKNMFWEAPFPLSASKLERLVRRRDFWGPRQLGVFYPALLRKECSLLLPRTVYGFEDLGFAEMYNTWVLNPDFFQCTAIGTVLACYEALRREQC